MPLHLYVYNDLPYLRDKPHPTAFLPLMDALEAALRALPTITFVEVEEQVARLATRSVPAPFPLALAIGNAGARVARLLNGRTGWFPRLRVVGMTRLEAEPGRW